MGNFKDSAGNWVRGQINQGMSAVQRSQSMSNKDLFRTAINGSGWDKATAQAELQKRADAVNGKSSGCFITTAVCDSFGKPDDCHELTMFREFRDGWLKNQSDGESLIARYYDLAPSIVEHINQLPNAREIYRGIWDKYLRPCLSCLEQGNHQTCKEIYVDMVETLATTY